MIYWDSSSVIKLYVRESDSEKWLSHACQTPIGMQISQLTRSELYFALNAKEARAEMPAGAAAILTDRFEKDIQAGVFKMTGLTASIFNRSVHIAKTSMAYPLRTLDGLHLACAIETGCRKIASADQRLLEVAGRFGISAI